MLRVAWLRPGACDHTGIDVDLVDYPGSFGDPEPPSILIARPGIGTDGLPCIVERVLLRHDLLAPSSTEVMRRARRSWYVDEAAVLTDSLAAVLWERGR